MLRIDGKKAGSFPFGGFMPTGTMQGQLYVGGVSPSTLTPFGLTEEGFKGCLEQVHFSGRPLDFSANIKTRNIAFFSKRDRGSVYCFNGSTFTQYGKQKVPAFNIFSIVYVYSKLLHRSG